MNFTASYCEVFWYSFIEQSLMFTSTVHVYIDWVNCRWKLEAKENFNSYLVISSFWKDIKYKVIDESLYRICVAYPIMVQIKARYRCENCQRSYTLYINVTENSIYPVFVDGCINTRFVNKACPICQTLNLPLACSYRWLNLMVHNFKIQTGNLFYLFAFRNMV